MKRLIFLSFLFIVVRSFSQNDKLDIYHLDFNDLSKLKVVSASKVEQNIGEVPTTIRIINSEEIKSRGYFTLEEVLSDLPGFQFRNILGVNSYVFQRGIPNQNNLTLILIDGVQINELNSGGFYAGGQFNLANIEKIEVVYGPSSVAWGTNAVSGIINIISKNAKSNTGELHAAAGSFETTEADFAYSHISKDKGFAVRVSGMVKNSDKANLKSAEGDNNWTDLMDNFETDYNIGFKAETKNLTFGVNCLQKKTSTATFFKSVGTNYRDYGTLWNIRFVNAFLKFNKQFSDKLSLASMVYNRNSTVLKNTVYYVLDTAQVGYYRPNNLTGLENIFNYTVAENLSLTGGLIFEYEQLANGPSMTYSTSGNVKPPTPVKPEMKGDFLASVFVEPRYRLFKKLFLSGGLRFDQSTVYDQVLTPRVGMSYLFGRNLLRLSYSEAFRAPKPWDYSDGKGNSNLLPEKMRSIEAAVSIFANQNLRINVVGYKNELVNGIVKELLPDGYRWGNTGVIETTGTEFSLEYSAGKVSSYLNYTYSHSYNENGTSVAEISPHTGNAGVGYSFSDCLKFNLRANYVGKRENPKVISATNTNFIDPYFLLNGVVSYSCKGITIQLICKNILDTEYYHTSNRGPERYRQPQQTFMFNVGYSLGL